MDFSFRKIVEQRTGMTKFRFTMMTATDRALAFMDSKRMEAAVAMHRPETTATGTEDMTKASLETSARIVKKTPRQKSHTEGMVMEEAAWALASDTFLKTFPVKPEDRMHRRSRPTVTAV